MPFEQLLYILHHQGLTTFYLQTQTYSTMTKATENIFSFELITPMSKPFRNFSTRWVASNTVTPSAPRALWLQEKCKNKNKQKTGKWKTGNEQTEMTFQLYRILYFLSFT